MGLEGAVEGLFIGAERRWRRGAAVVADGQLCSAPSMAWGQLRLLAGVAERRERRGHRHTGEDEHVEEGGAHY